MEVSIYSFISQSLYRIKTSVIYNICKNIMILAILNEVLYHALSPMNSGFIILLNIIEISFIVLTGLEKKVSSMPYILNLSMCDLVTGLLIFAVKGLYSIAMITGDKISFIIASQMSIIMINLPLIVSVLTFSMLTIDRLLAVKKPFMYRNLTSKRKRSICLGIWIIAITFTVSHLVIGDYVGLKRTESLYLTIIAIIGMPFPIISYILIKQALRRSQAISSGATREANKGEQRMLSLCVKTFVAYLVCWVPYTIYSLGEYFQVFIFAELPLLNRFAFLIIFVNSSMNPLICLHHFGVHRIIKNRFQDI